jgi:hypothetical protein
MTGDEKLSEFWKVTATSTNEKGEEFVAAIESKEFPIMATQFHPEKPGHLFNTTGVNSAWESVMINREFGDKFVSLARMNPNDFPYDDAAEMLIENSKFLLTTEYGVEGIYIFP